MRFFFRDIFIFKSDASKRVHVVDRKPFRFLRVYIYIVQGSIVTIRSCISVCYIIIAYICTIHMYNLYTYTVHNLL